MYLCIINNGGPGDPVPYVCHAAPYPSLKRRRAQRSIIKATTLARQGERHREMHSTPLIIFVLFIFQGKIQLVAIIIKAMSFVL